MWKWLGLPDTNEQETDKQELTTLRERVVDLERQVVDYEGQVVNLERQVVELEGQVVVLNRQLKEAKHEWVVKRKEIQIMRNQPLGVGGWGCVFKGKFRGSDVAVKEIFPDIMSPFNKALFEREVEIASKCRHPCLLQFIGATADDEVPLLVTEIMDCSLREKLYPDEAELPLSREEVCDISLDVARALNYLHQKRQPIVHRDISSGNVLLRYQGGQWRAKVSDYGTANFLHQSMINSPGAEIYCAPEIHPNKGWGAPISCKVDVYNFGVLLCEMSIREVPDPLQRNKQIARMRKGKFQNLARRCVAREPWRRPNMESVIKKLEKPETGEEEFEEEESEEEEFEEELDAV